MNVATRKAPSRSPRPAFRLILASAAPSTINAGMMMPARPETICENSDAGGLTLRAERLHGPASAK